MIDKITPIGVRFKKPISDEKMLTIVEKRKCIEHSYIVDPEANHVTCSRCNKDFSPMSVLIDLARKESRWHYNQEKYHDEMKRLDEKQRTKCQHCHKMTRIK